MRDATGWLASHPDAVRLLLHRVWVYWDGDGDEATVLHGDVHRFLCPYSGPHHVSGCGVVKAQGYGHAHQMLLNARANRSVTR